LWLAHLAHHIISQSKCYQNLIREPAHLKLELDTFVFPLPLNRTFPRGFGRYGYSGLCAHLASLPENESSFAAYESIFIMDSIRQLLKLLHTVV
jgi:hypothetical protein